MRLMLRTLPLILVASSLPAFAQDSQSSLSGSFLTPGRSPVAGALVVATNTETGYVRRSRTDVKGRFVLVQMPVGPYKVEASAEGFQSSVFTTTLSLAAGASIRFTAFPDASATVTVSASKTPLDSDRQTASTAVSPEALRILPVKGRGFMDFAALTPGVQSVQRGNMGIGGQRAVSTSVLIDGAQLVQPYFGGVTGAVENKAPYSFSLESIREFEVVTAGAPAEFGQMAGGFLNAVTKSGTNEAHGSVFYFQKPDSMRARDPLTGASSDGFKNIQYGASIGGPITKDRLFYFAAYEAQRESTPVPFQWGGPGAAAQLDPSVPADAALIHRAQAWSTVADSDVFFGRLDWLPSVDQSFTFRINLTRFLGDTGPGAVTANNTSANYSYEGTASDDARTLSGEVRWNWIIGPSLVHETRLSWVQDDLPRNSRGALPTVQIGNEGIYGGYPYPRDFHSERTEVFDAITYARPGFQLRGGFDLNSILVKHAFTPFGAGAYTFASLQAFEAGMWSYYGQTVGVGMPAEQAGRMSAREQDLAFFIQTETELTPTVRLNIGARWDEQRHPDFPIADVSAGPQLYPQPGQNPLNGRIPTDSSFSGRASFTWAPTEATVVRGSWGQYVSRTPSTYDYEALVGNGRRLSLVLIPGGPGGPLPWGPTFDWEAPASIANPQGINLPPTLYTFAPNFRNPRSTVSSLGVERAVGSWVLGLSGTYTRTSDLERVQDQNLGTPMPNAQGRLVFPALRPNPTWGPMYVFVSDASSRYQAVTFSAKHHQAGSPWNAQLFYTWGHDRDNDSNERALLGFHEQNTQRLNDEWGASDRDRRHVITGYLSYEDQTWTGIQTGLILSYLSGSPYSANKTSDLNNDAVSDNDRVIGTTRNGYRTASRTEVDLRLARDWRISTRARLTASLEVFNLLNHQDRFEQTRAVADAPDAAAVQVEIVPAVVSVPRSIQLGLRVAF